MYTQINQIVPNVTCAALILTSLFGTAVSVQAQSGVTQPVGNSDTMAAYRQMATIPTNAFVVPTVVEAPLPPAMDDVDSFTVFESGTNRFIPLVRLNTQEPIELRSQIMTTPAVGNSRALIDTRYDTFAEFPAGAESANQVVLTLTTMQPVDASAVRLTLAPQVAAPITVAIRTGQSTTDLRPSVVQTRYPGNTVRFPAVTARVFEVTLTHIQPLRIADLSVVPSVAQNVESAGLRFLAQPGSSYVVVADADRFAHITLPESGNLRSDQDVVLLQPLTFRPNVTYQPADIDQDGVPDMQDNCVSTFNPEQIDIDRNGRGDVCDDFDRDGVMNDRDNCVNQPNRAQRDEDGDGIGDSCDEEESRFTEQNPWVPWVGMGMAALTILILFGLVAVGSRKQETEPTIE
jgi:hypothetical protein